MFVYEAKLDRVLHEQDVIAPEDKPITVTFRAHLPKGRPNISVINDVPGPSNNPRSGRHGRKPFISTQDGRIPWQMKLTDEQGRPRYPFLVLDSVSFRGPIITEDEQRRRDEYFPRDAGNIDQIRAGLEQHGRDCAFRRPVTSEELDGYVGIVQAELAAGEKFPDAVKAGMLAILCSKSFLFLAEGDENADRQYAQRLGNRFPPIVFALEHHAGRRTCSRWPSRASSATNPSGREQVARMLADPRADCFGDSFATQWLHLRKVGRFPPDKKLYPDYDTSLEKSMIGETKAFFREVLHGNLSLREFLHSDWGMLNSRLARSITGCRTQISKGMCSGACRCPPRVGVADC